MLTRALHCISTMCDARPLPLASVLASGGGGESVGVREGVQRLETAPAADWPAAAAAAAAPQACAPCAGVEGGGATPLSTGAPRGVARRQLSLPLGIKGGLPSAAAATGWWHSEEEEEEPGPVAPAHPVDPSSYHAAAAPDASSSSGRQTTLYPQRQ
ncbi:hypothetical protein EON68_01930 [archaeon]|nr:MAG: hypothetical protein EON68_01930 [archaeon]